MDESTKEQYGSRWEDFVRVYLRSLRADYSFEKPIPSKKKEGTSIQTITFFCQIYKCKYVYFRYSLIYSELVKFPG